MIEITIYDTLLLLKRIGISENKYRVLANYFILKNGGTINAFEIVYGKNAHYETVLAMEIKALLQ